jgi:hypothetical protein
MVFWKRGSQVDRSTRSDRALEKPNHHHGDVYCSDLMSSLGAIPSRFSLGGRDGPGGSVRLPSIMVGVAQRGNGR